jgi:hypothetical protein
MAALPPLSRALRYGDVRGTHASSLDVVVDSMLTRICVGLPAAVTSLDDDAAAALRDAVDATAGAVALLQSVPLRDRWLDALLAIAGRDDVHGLVAGRLARLLYDAGRVSDADTERRLARVLTVGTPPATAGAWIEGFFAGGGLLLVHDAGLLRVVDAWLAGVPADTFPEALPLLRRTFGAFATPARRAVLERVRHLDAPTRASHGGLDGSDGLDRFDDERAAGVVPVVRQLLGWPA